MTMFQNYHASNAINNMKQNDNMKTYEYEQYENIDRFNLTLKYYFDKSEFLI